MPEVTDLTALCGVYVNHEYTLPNGEKIKYLDDNSSYLGCQIKSELSDNRVFGLVSNGEFILV